MTDRKLKVAVQMDALADINTDGDSSFALMLEAQNRGHEVYHYSVDDISFGTGVTQARVRRVTLRDQSTDFYTLGEEELRELSNFQVILMRQDPPFDLNYITATYALEGLHRTTVVSNNPASVRNSPEKLLVLRYHEFMPATLITRDRRAIDNFLQEHREIVMKPLYGNGGASVFLLKSGDPNYSSLVENFEQMSNEPWVCQKFLPRVVHGDKRIILVDGVVCGAINRVPGAGEIRSNMSRGGQAVGVDLTAREKEICDVIGPDFRRLGLTLVGIDVIDDCLTEINVTSPTGLRTMSQLGIGDPASDVWNALERQVKELSA